MHAGLTPLNPDEIWNPDRPRFRPVWDTVIVETMGMTFGIRGNVMRSMQIDRRKLGLGLLWPL